MTDDEIKRLRALCEAATPGPWKEGSAYTALGAPSRAPGYWASHGPQHVLPGSQGDISPSSKAHHDARLIAAARTALPKLLDEVEQMGKDIDGMLESNRVIARERDALRSEVERLRSELQKAQAWKDSARNLERRKP